MNTQNLHFVTAIGLFVTTLVLIAGYYYFQSRRSSPSSWEELLAKLTWIDRNSIAEVALDLVDESGQPKVTDDAGNLDPSLVWQLTGGLKGLEALERNSEVLIDLAFYVQQWYPEALVVAEQLRLNAREIEWHVERLKGARQTGKLESAFPMYAQQAVATYYLMTRRLLALYEQGNLAMLADLRNAL